MCKSVIRVHPCPSVVDQPEMLRMLRFVTFALLRFRSQERPMFMRVVTLLRLKTPGWGEKNSQRLRGHGQGCSQTNSQTWSNLVKPKKSTRIPTDAFRRGGPVPVSVVGRDGRHGRLR